MKIEKTGRHEKSKSALPPQCGCSIDRTLEVIGGKWKASILWRLTEAKRPVRFAELKRALPEITQRMLTRQLRELESHGIIYRNVYPVVPPRVEYSMTDTGKTLIPVLDAMHRWASPEIEIACGNE
mgnify:CR=1 FL=1